MPTRPDRIYRALKVLQPIECELRDDSANHHGHAGASGGEYTHLTLKIVSAAFEGKSRVECHRMVNALLAEEFAMGLHALNIRASAP